MRVASCLGVGSDTGTSLGSAPNSTCSGLSPSRLNRTETKCSLLVARSDAATRGNLSPLPTRRFHPLDAGYFVLSSFRAFSMLDAIQTSATSATFGDVMKAIPGCMSPIRLVKSKRATDCGRKNAHHALSMPTPQLTKQADHKPMTSQGCGRSVRSGCQSAAAFSVAP